MPRLRSIALLFLLAPCAFAAPVASTFTVPITYYKLPNGLKVALSRDTIAPPKNRTGFAYLFEQLMFEGLKNLPKGEFDKLIRGQRRTVQGKHALRFH